MLSVGRLIQVSVQIGPNAVLGRTFNTLMIAGDSNVISGVERFRDYETLDDVANDFGLTAPEYLAAALYYGQSPKPVNLQIGRWLASNTSGFNLGGIQTPAEQVLSNWTGITSGGFQVSIDGAALQNITGLNFAAQTNLNGIANVISGALSGATCIWNGTAFQITSNSTGAGASAQGTITFTGNPSPDDTLTIQGSLITFVASSPVGNQVVVGATQAVTFANLLTFLQQSIDANIDLMTYAQASSTVIEVTAKITGTAGNAYTLVRSSAVITLSGATLTGGSTASSVGYAVPPLSGVDISGQLALTNGTNQELATGFNAEEPEACLLALAQASPVWYGVMFATTQALTTTQILNNAEFIEGQAVTRMYGVTNQNPNTLSSLVANDISSLLQAGGYTHTFSQYSNASPATVAPYVVASYFGRMFSVNFNVQNSTINLMWKQEPGVTAENLQDPMANALESKHCNVFAGYDNGSALIQYGVSASGDWTDQVWGLDWFQNAVQTAVFNLFYTATTKVPQTDAGQNQELTAISTVCGDQPGGAVYNGLAAPGVWNSSEEFGSLTTGQFLSLGYYVFAPSVDIQAQSDRETRQAPPAQIALKLAGAFQGANVLVTVNQ